MKQPPRFFLASVVAMSLSCVGCGGGTSANLGQVQGTVTLDGVPLADAQVVFSPEGGRPSAGVTDSAGKYTLTYIHDVKGAAVGHHRVRVDSVPPQMPEPGQGEVKIVPFVEKIPAQYNNKSTLTADVKPGENTIDFSLTSK